MTKTSNIIPFPMWAHASKPDTALQELLGGIRDAIERRGGIWDAKAQAPRIQRLRELLASAEPAEPR